MAIKNYTSTKHPLESIGEIQAALARGGAKKVMIEYDGKGEPAGIAFAIATDCGYAAFRLPANIDGVMEVFKRQKVKVDEAQAMRTAWRNVRDWVLAQLAFIEAGNATIQEAFLPYLTNGSGETLYQAYLGGRLLLGGQRQENGNEF